MTVTLEYVSNALANQPLYVLFRIPRPIPPRRQRNLRVAEIVPDTHLQSAVPVVNATQFVCLNTLASSSVSDRRPSNTPPPARRSLTPATRVPSFYGSSRSAPKSVWGVS